MTRRYELLSSFPDFVRGTPSPRSQREVLPPPDTAMLRAPTIVRFLEKSASISYT